MFTVTERLESVVRCLSIEMTSLTAASTLDWAAAPLTAYACTDNKLTLLSPHMLILHSTTPHTEHHSQSDTINKQLFYATSSPLTLDWVKGDVDTPPCALHLQHQMVSRAEACLLHGKILQFVRVRC